MVRCSRAHFNRLRACHRQSGAAQYALAANDRGATKTTVAKTRALQIKAGPKALALLESDGLAPASVRMIAGASGGAKWLVLSGLDRVLIEHMLPGLEAPVHLIGSSIGAWRFACYAQRDPMAAITRFERAYLEQTYSDKPDRDEISRVSREILEQILGPDGARDITRHPVLRLNVMAVRARHLTASERTGPLGLGLAGAMLANHVSRRALGAFFERALFHDPRSRAPFFDVDDFPIHRIELSADNVADAVLASGAIPFVLSGVTDIAGAPAGVYRDGGVIDYHFDLPLSDEHGITLYPHFYGHLIPGWFDKKRRRRPRPAHLDRVLLLSPSDEFVATLPHGKIPDRTDFTSMPTADRLAAWRTAVAESARLGDEFLELWQGGRLAEYAEPLT